MPAILFGQVISRNELRNTNNLIRAHTVARDGGSGTNLTAASRNTDPAMNLDQQGSVGAATILAWRSNGVIRYTASLLNNGNFRITDAINGVNFLEYDDDLSYLVLAAASNHFNGVVYFDNDFFLTNPGSNAAPVAALVIGSDGKVQHGEIGATTSSVSNTVAANAILSNAGKGTNNELANLSVKTITGSTNAIFVWRNTNGTALAEMSSNGVLRVFSSAGKQWMELAPSALGNSVNYGFLHHAATGLVGLGGETYTNDVISEGYNQSASVAVPARSGSPMLIRTVEYKWFQGGEYIGEYHPVQWVDTNGVLHRMEHYAMEWDGGGAFHVSTLDYHSFRDWNGGEVFLFDMRAGARAFYVGRFTNSAALYFMANNTQGSFQRNAANSAWLNLPWYDNEDRLKFDASFKATGPTPTTGGYANIYASLNPDSIQANGQILNISGPNIAGDIYVVKGAVNASGNIFHYLENTGDGNAVFYARAVGAGDPKILFTSSTNASVNWSLGTDQSDNNMFKLSAAIGLETSTFFSLDRTNRFFGLFTNIPAAGFHVNGTVQLDNTGSNSTVVSFYGKDATGIMVETAAPVGGGGEANTASNLGAGLNTYNSKSGVDLRFNTFSNAGDGVTISSNANLFTINVDWGKVMSQTNATAMSNAIVALIASGTAAGDSGAVQFNQGDAFAGTNEFRFDRTNRVFYVPGGIFLSNTAAGVTFRRATADGGSTHSDSWEHVGLVSFSVLGTSNLWRVVPDIGSSGPDFIRAERDTRKLTLGTDSGGASLNEVVVDATFTTRSNLVSGGSVIASGTGAAVLTLSNTVDSTKVTFTSTGGAAVVSGNLKYTIALPAITVSNLVVSGATNTIECVGLTNIVLTNILEEATGTKSETVVLIRNTLGVSVPIVWPAYGAQHGYFFNTNAVHDVRAITACPPGTNMAISVAQVGTNTFTAVNTYPRP